MSGSMSGVWKRRHGRTSEAPPDESGGNRSVRPTATAPHLDSTVFRSSVYRLPPEVSKEDRRAAEAEDAGGARAGYSRPARS